MPSAVADNINSTHDGHENYQIEVCEVCGVNKAKYTCPKCEVRTCGLTCVNIHKKELECDGIRDKTKFIPLKSFTDLDLLSDYRLLEDIGRSVEQYQRNPANKYSRQINLPVHLQRLKYAAFNREVDLQFMPQNFSRHKENTTYLNWKSNELFWKVEFIFPQADNVKWVVDRVLETKSLSILLEEIFYKEIQSESESNDLKNNILVLRNKLKFYRSCGLSGLSAFLKAEKIKKSNSRFYELDLTSSLQENLKNKTIIEFPIIYIALKHHSHMFDIIDSDNEETNEQIIEHKKRKEVVELKKKSRVKKSVTEDTDSTNNYFFNAECSDSEEDNDGVKVNVS